MPQPPQATPASLFRFGSFSKARLEAFSDGVFAIIVTLLVLELRVPHIENAQSVAELAAALLALAPKFVSWVISFAIVCVIWLNHHRVLDQFRGVNNGIFWMNALLLLGVSFIPFPTALLGDYPSNPLAVSFFGVALALMGLAFVAMRAYALTHRDLFKDGVDTQAFIAGTRRALIFGPLLYVAGAAVAWLAPVLAFAIYAFIPIYFIFPRDVRGANTGARV
jgi:uncharacterized membrane protein